MEKIIKNVHKHMNTNGSDFSKVDECLAGKSFTLTQKHGWFKNPHLNMASKTYHINISVTKKVNDFTNLFITKNILQKL